jgi:hypothetical protein
MKFQCEIDMNNAAFEHDPEGELARILYDVRARVMRGEPAGYCRDVNGNHVGSWGITPP